MLFRSELKPDRVLVHFYVGVSLLQGESFPKGGGSPYFFIIKNQNGRPKSLNRRWALYGGSKKQVNSSNTIDVGEPRGSLSERFYPIDTKSFFVKCGIRISAQLIELYRKGLSLRDIA